ncbi:MAG: energy-coupling factor transporter ATPase [Clostridiales bacterium]|jgi:energy-coupling factor transport system ATP-binding protein|nr:energy-coupling factor transporter ATPase [Clostridiales bacterium]
MLEAKNVKFEYSYNSSVEFSSEIKEEKITALSGIDVKIKQGEFVAVLGRNGSGKSTLAKLFNAMIVPSDGTVIVNGLDTKLEENIWQARQYAGMVFQNPDNQIVASIVEEDVAFGPENLGIPSAEIRKRVDSALSTVGMSEFSRRATYHLSGGQKQRVAIAGVIAMHPQCVIFDESTAMLDPIGRKEVMSAAVNLNKKNGITVVIITHFMEEAAIADRVIVMDDGKIVADASPKDVFFDVKKMRSLGLDVPQATEISYELQKKGVNIPLTLTVEQLADEIEKLAKGNFKAQA